MSGEISVTPEQLSQQAKVYTQAKDQIEQAMQSVGNMNNTIAEEWKGQAFKAYLEQYSQVYQQAQKYCNLLVSINQQLNNYAQTTQERDAQDATQFKF